MYHQQVLKEAKLWYTSQSPPCSPTQEQISKFDEYGEACAPCFDTSGILFDWEASQTSNWNRRVIELLADKFVSLMAIKDPQHKLNGGQPYKRTDAAKVFKTRLRYQCRPRTTSLETKAKEQARARRLNRRQTVFHLQFPSFELVNKPCLFIKRFERREKIVKYMRDLLPSDETWKAAERVVGILGHHGVSEDESEPGEGSNPRRKVIRALYRPWLNPAITTLVAGIDSYAATADDAAMRQKPGNVGFHRLSINTAKVDKREHMVRLPRNFYTDDYYKGLTALKQRQLCAKEAVEIPQLVCSSLDCYSRF